MGGMGGMAPSTPPPTGVRGRSQVLAIDKPKEHGTTPTLDREHIRSDQGVVKLSAIHFPGLTLDTFEKLLKGCLDKVEQVQEDAEWSKAKPTPRRRRKDRPGSASRERRERRGTEAPPLLQGLSGGRVEIVPAGTVSQNSEGTA